MIVPWRLSNPHFSPLTIRAVWSEMRTNRLSNCTSRKADRSGEPSPAIAEKSEKCGIIAHGRNAFHHAEGLEVMGRALADSAQIGDTACEFWVEDVQIAGSQRLPERAGIRVFLREPLASGYSHTTLFT